MHRERILYLYSPRDPNQFKSVSRNPLGIGEEVLLESTGKPQCKVL